MPVPKDLKIADYSYELPEDRIAKYPNPQRDSSRILLYENGLMSEAIFRNISDYIAPGSLLVFNDTRVVAARLLFPRPGGSLIEVFCLEPDIRYKDLTEGMAQTGEVYWKCLIGKADKWKEKELHLVIPEAQLNLTATIAARAADAFVVHLHWGSALSFAEVLQLAGAVPLPPYIKRKAEEADKQRYQTIYGRSNGSVAAPTAGLHFTQAIFDQLTEKGIETGFVTLHVGAGTFKPVKTEAIGQHAMHAEWMEVTLSFIELLIGTIKSGRPVIAVGTTAARTLESLCCLGQKINVADRVETDKPVLEQWEAYDLNNNVLCVDALEGLAGYLRAGNKDRLLAQTKLMIAPGYRWQIVKGLITNFHQPGSTLLLLVASLIGDDWRKVYAYALAHGFRFLSYGDGCFLKAKTE